MIQIGLGGLIGEEERTLSYEERAALIYQVCFDHDFILTLTPESNLKKSPELILTVRLTFEN